MDEKKNLQERVQGILDMVKQVPDCQFGSIGEHSADDICEMLNTWLKSPDKESVSNMLGILHHSSFEEWLQEVESKVAEAVSIEYAKVVMEYLSKSPGDRFEAGSQLFYGLDTVRLVETWYTSKDKPGISKVFVEYTGQPFNAWLKLLFCRIVSHMHRQELEDFLTRNPNLKGAVK